MVWKIEFDPKAQKELKKLDKDTQQRIVRVIKDKIAMQDDPRSMGEALKGPNLGEFWKYRVGDYRLICDIQDEKIIIVILRIGHRKEIYK